MFADTCLRFCGGFESNLLFAVLAEFLIGFPVQRSFFTGFRVSLIEKMNLNSCDNILYTDLIDRSRTAGKVRFIIEMAQAVTKYYPRSNR